MRSAALAQPVDGGIQPLRRHACLLQGLSSLRLGREGKRKQQPFNGNETVARLRRDLLCLIEDTRDFLIPLHLSATARYLWYFRNGGIDGDARALGIAAGRRDQAGEHAVGIGPGIIDAIEPLHGQAEGEPHETRAGGHNRRLPGANPGAAWQAWRHATASPAPTGGSRDHSLSSIRSRAAGCRIALASPNARRSKR
jgi:hypothetical protein